MRLRSEILEGAGAGAVQYAKKGAGAIQNAEKMPVAVAASVQGTEQTTGCDGGYGCRSPNKMVEDVDAVEVYITLFSSDFF